MSKYILLLACLFAALRVCSQEQILRGQVSDTDGTAVFAANVSWVKSPQRGVVTGMDGQFTLPFSQKPADTLRISYVGYESALIPLASIPGEEQLQVTLRRQDALLGLVSVEAERPIAADYTVRELERLDIYLNPLAGADPLRAITALPASTNTNESANPELRGSASDRSRVVINDVPIYRPVRNTQINGLGTFSIFNTELIRKQYVHPDNPPLTQGNSTAGLVAIETVDEVRDNALQLSASLANVGVQYSTSISEKGFLQLYANQQFAGPFLQLNGHAIPVLRDFSTRDAGIHAGLQLGADWRLKLLSYGIQEDFTGSFTQFGSDYQVMAEKDRTFHVFRARKATRRGWWQIAHGNNFSRTSFRSRAISAQQDYRKFYQRLDYKHLFSEELSLQQGLQHVYREYRYQDDLLQFQEQDPQTIACDVDREQSIYSSWQAYQFLNWRPDGDLDLFAAWRGLHSAQQGLRFSAQVGLRYELRDQQQLILRAGSYEGVASPGNQDRRFLAQSSRQLSLDYRYDNDDDLRLQAAAYAKNEHNSRGQGIYSCEADQDLIGLEASLEWQASERWSFQLNGSHLWQRVVDGEQAYAGRLDELWIGRAALAYRNPNLLDISLFYLVNGGTRYTTLQQNITNGQAEFAGPFNGQLLPNYRSLNLSISRFFAYEQYNVVVFLNANNLLNRGNPQAPRYNANIAQQGYDNFAGRVVYFGAVLQL